MGKQVKFEHNGAEVLLPKQTVISLWLAGAQPAAPRKVPKLGEYWPGEGRPICATCEGRVIGAGLAGSREIAGRPVMFRSRKASEVAA